MSDLLSENAPAPDTALTVIPAKNLPTILAADQNDILGKLRDKVRNHKPDISTPAGREKIRSLAYDIAQSKVALIKLGKSLTEDWRVKTKAVNAECNIIEEKMDALKEEIRAPLTAFENREKARVKAHEDALWLIQSLAMHDAELSVSEIDHRLEQIEIRFSRDWEEFSQRASDESDRTAEYLTRLRAETIKREAEAAELERMRAEKAERERLEAIRLQEEREARIAQEAAEAARVEAEAKAAREAKEAAQRAEEARLAAEREAQEAQDFARREAARLQAEADAERERAERAIEAAKRAEENARERERLNQEAADRREREAVEAERKRQESERLVSEEAARQRESDKAHKSAVMRAAKEALIAEVSINEALAVMVVKAIVAGKIPAVRVVF